MKKLSYLQLNGQASGFLCVCVCACVDVCVSGVILTQSSAACFRRKAVKATLVLLPLLGITYMLFFVNPGEDDIAQIVFIYFNSFLQSFQVRGPVMTRPNGGKPTQKQGPPSESRCVLSQSCRTIPSWTFSGCESSSRQMIWSSALSVLPDNTALLLAQSSHLTGLTLSCRRDFSSVDVFSLQSSPLKCVIPDTCAQMLHFLFF